MFGVRTTIARPRSKSFTRRRRRADSRRAPRAHSARGVRERARARATRSKRRAVAYMVIFVRLVIIIIIIIIFLYILSFFSVLGDETPPVSDAVFHLRVSRSSTVQRNTGSRSRRVARRGPCAAEPFTKLIS